MKYSVDNKGRWIVGKNGLISQGPWKGYTPKQAVEAIKDSVRSEKEVERNMRESHKRTGFY